MIKVGIRLFIMFVFIFHISYSQTNKKVDENKEKIQLEEVYNKINFQQKEVDEIKKTI